MPRTWASERIVPLAAVVLAVAHPCDGAARFHDDAPMTGKALWTGTEMIFWGGTSGSGARYDPAANVWHRMSTATNAPGWRSGFGMVWAGSELLVWGGLLGGGYTNTGARYEPRSDSWRPLSTAAGCPTARGSHSAVWTGAEMIVWGGYDGYSYLDDGGRYDPATNVWLPIAPTSSTPRPRRDHAAVWTGNRMVVWGGRAFSNYVTGGTYDPVTDAWAPTSTGPGCPTARTDFTTVWTGSQMIVWGGQDGAYGNSGARYDIGTDTWTPTSIGGPSPPTGRWAHTAVWTGAEMIVWGGESAGGQLGDAYDPATDAWRPVSSTGAPSARSHHAAVWTGSEMIVWGQWMEEPASDGGSYDPATDAWAPVLGEDGPDVDGPAVWTGTELLVFPVYQASAWRFDPDREAWSVTSPGPTPTSPESVVWTGVEAITWGGATVRAGRRYDPSLDTWGSVNPNSPAALYLTSAVWTGTEMITWGGATAAVQQNTGGRYDPVSDSWLATSTSPPVPSPRWGHGAVWTGTEMVIWGARYPAPTDTGGRYDPSTDSWRTTSTGAGVPSPRMGFSATWSGTRMIIWGGDAQSIGGAYDPAADSWQPMGTSGQVPSARRFHGADWTGTSLVVWGGESLASLDLDTGALYDPVLDTWRRVTTEDAPEGRFAPHVVWTGRDVLVEGGGKPGGGLYDPARDVWNHGPRTRGDVALAGKGPGGTALYDAAFDALRVDGVQLPWTLDPFPGETGGGVNLCGADVVAGGAEEMLAAHGPSAQFSPRVLGFDRARVPITGLDFLAYGANGFGVNVAAGPIDGAERIVTGAGPSPAYGPHVRGWQYAGGAVTPIAKVSFFAYGTLRFGANDACGDTDGDGFDEILAGPGPGSVFGPHVRGFNYDGVSTSAISGVNFFAYGTLRYGVRLATGDVDGDAFAELLTGPGPSNAFSSQLRGFDVDGGPALPIARINAVAFSGSRYGLNVSAGDLETDGFAEIVCGAGPDPAFGSRMSALDFDGTVLSPIPPLQSDVFGLGFGIRIAAADLAY